MESHIHSKKLEIICSFIRKYSTYKKKKIEKHVTVIYPTVVTNFHCKKCDIYFMGESGLLLHHKICKVEEGNSLRHFHH